MGMYRTYKRWRSDLSGATAIEYALVAGIMAAAFVGLHAMVDGTGGMFGKIKLAFDTYLP